MSPFERIIPAIDLPDSLWADEILRIAPRLADAYRDSIAAHNLTRISLARSPKVSPVGGTTPQAADEHFAQAFDGSAARTELAFLDPKEEVVNVADALAKVGAGGRIAVLDLPSGAGAFSLAFLCTLAELRARDAVPRVPLEAVVIGGELNSRATHYAKDLYGRVRHLLAAQAVDVEYKPMHWDVCDPISTAMVLKRFVADADMATRKLVVVSNFSGFMKTRGKRKEAEPQLDEVFRFCTGARSTALWIEPQTNAATDAGGVLQWVVDMVTRRLPRVAEFVGLAPGQAEAPAMTQVGFALPLFPGRTSVVRLAILRFDLRDTAP